MGADDPPTPHTKAVALIFGLGQGRLNLLEVMIALAKPAFSWAKGMSESDISPGLVRYTRISTTKYSEGTSLNWSNILKIQGQGFILSILPASGEWVKKAHEYLRVYRFPVRGDQPYIFVQWIFGHLAGYKDRKK